MYQDDDIIVNVAQSKKTSTQSPTLVAKSQIKKNKYSAKFIKAKQKKFIERKNFSQMLKAHNKRPNSLADMYGDGGDDRYQQMEIQDKSKAPASETANHAAEESQKRKNNHLEKQKSSAASFLNKKQNRVSSSVGNKQRFRREDDMREERPNISVPIKNREQIGGVAIPKQLIPSTTKKGEHKNTVPITQLSLHTNLQKSLIENNFQKLTSIQSECFGPISSKKNCIVKAATGSGKTLAYLIPIIDGLLKSGQHISREQGSFAIVICPTRQLCIQAEKQTLKCVKRSAYIIPGSLMGGQEIKKEKARLRKGINILFATPGRLDYHMQNTQSFILKNLAYLIFEQADRTLDMGFNKQITRILNVLESKIQLPKVQKILVSAHFNDKVEELVDKLSSSQLEYIGFKKMQGQEGNENQEPEKQKEINISSQLKQTYVLVSEEERIPMLIAYLNLLNKCKVLIFFSTIDEVEYFEFMFNNMYYRDCNGNYTEQKLEKRPVFKLHGDIDQKIRSNTYFSFRKEPSCILLSTEVASRGLDFPDLTHIVLFDIPATITDYANRIGRTARMNSTGVSLLILNYQESEYVEQLKVYTPNITPIDKDLIFGSFSKILQKMNIGTDVLYYLEGIIRGLVKDDQEKYQMARRAYVSMLRAYARLPNKEIFAVKKLNLKYLAKNFGLNSVRSRTGEATPGNKKSTAAAAERDYEALRKKRKVQDIRQLQVSEYI